MAKKKRKTYKKIKKRNTATTTDRDGKNGWMGIGLGSWGGANECSHQVNGKEKNEAENGR